MDRRWECEGLRELELKLGVKRGELVWMYERGRKWIRNEIGYKLYLIWIEVR